MGRRVPDHVQVPVEALRRRRSAERHVRRHRRRDVELLHAGRRRLRQAAARAGDGDELARAPTSQNSEVTRDRRSRSRRSSARRRRSSGGNVVDTPLTLDAGTLGRLDADHVHVLLAPLQPGRRPRDAACRSPARRPRPYTPTVADIGFSIRVWITGDESAGLRHRRSRTTRSRSSTSRTSRRARRRRPTIAGTRGLGRQLTANIGAYSGDAPIKTTFVWQRCDATGGACHTIASATKIVYFPTTRRRRLHAAHRRHRDERLRQARRAVRPDRADRRGAAAPSRAGTSSARAGRLPRRRRLRRRRSSGIGGNDTMLGGAGDDRHRRRRGQRRHHGRRRRRPALRRRRAPTRSTRPTASATPSTAAPGSDRVGRRLVRQGRRTARSSTAVARRPSRRGARRLAEPRRRSSRCANASRRCARSVASAGERELEPALALVRQAQVRDARVVSRLLALERPASSARLTSSVTVLCAS